MCELASLFIVLLVLVCFVTYPIRRTIARAKANRIINGEEPATPKQINKCIDQLLATKHWYRDMTEADCQRVRRLRDIRNEMVTPHG